MKNLQIYLDQDYVDILRQVLEERKEKNDQYSLRAFARDIGLSPSRLSLIFNRKGHLSVRSAYHVSGRMNWDKLETTYFVSLVKARVNRSVEARWEAIRLARAIRLRKAYQNFNATLLKELGWKHFVVRFLLTSPDNSKVSFQEIADRVGIRLGELETCVRQLLQAGLMEQDEDGKFHCRDLIAVDEEKPSRPVQIFHKSILEKAITSLSEDDFKRRFFRSCIFTLNQAQYQQLQDMIVDFVSSCTDLDEMQDDPHDDIYAMGVQLIPLTNKFRRKSSGKSVEQTLR